MTEDGNFPAVGSCFEELAEGEEFDVYDKYSQAVLSSDCRLALEGLLCRKDVTEKLISSGKGFVEAVKFYLPKLLLEPIFHCANYFKYLEVSLINIFSFGAIWNALSTISNSLIDPSGKGYWPVKSSSWNVRLGVLPKPWHCLLQIKVFDNGCRQYLCLQCFKNLFDGGLKQ